MTDPAKPTRIRLSRGRGWRLQTVSVALNGLPAVKVTRPSRWGNPFRVSDAMPRDQTVAAFRGHMADMLDEPGNIIPLDELRGKNLACWCPIDGPCHADVLLELANRDD